MAEFDSIAQDTWAEVSRVFCDQVEWVQQDGTVTLALGHCDAVYEEVGEAAGEKLVSCEMEASDIPAPVNGDVCRVLSGLLAGEYEYAGVLDSDGFTITVRLRLIP